MNSSFDDALQSECPGHGGGYPTDLMTEYTFVRRFRSPVYFGVATVLLIVAGFFLYVAFRNPVFWLFCALFTAGFIATLAAIVRNDTAGISVNEHSVSCWCADSRSEAIPLNEIIAVDFDDRSDSSYLRITTVDTRTIVCDLTSIADGLAVLDAIGCVRPEIELRHNGNRR